MLRPYLNVLIHITLLVLVGSLIISTSEEEENQEKEDYTHILYREVAEITEDVPPQEELGTEAKDPAGMNSNEQFETLINEVEQLKNGIIYANRKVHVIEIVSTHIIHW